MTECKAVVEPVHVSAEEKAFVRRVREVVEEALERERRKRGWPIEAHPPEPEPPVCGVRVLTCQGLFQELTIALPKCGPDFYKLCDFDHLIRICPFDPAWDAFEWKQKALTDRLQELEVKVKELQAKVPTRK